MQRLIYTKQQPTHMKLLLLFVALMTGLTVFGQNHTPVQRLNGTHKAAGEIGGTFMHWEWCRFALYTLKKKIKFEHQQGPSHHNRRAASI